LLTWTKPITSRTSTNRAPLLDKQALWYTWFWRSSFCSFKSKCWSCKRSKSSSNTWTRSFNRLGVHPLYWLEQCLALVLACLTLLNYLVNSRKAFTQPAYWPARLWCMPPCGLFACLPCI
jgi:hypothetical protein